MTCDEVQAQSEIPGKRIINPRTLAFRASFLEAAAAHAEAELVRILLPCGTGLLISSRKYNIQH